MDIITAKNAPEAIGPYSHACAAGGFVFTSGQLGLNSATGALPEGIEAQAEQAMKNLGEVLRAAELGFADVVKTTCFLKSMLSKKHVVLEDTPTAKRLAVALGR